MKILILKPSSLGDVVQALPVLRLLKQHWPDSRISWWLADNLLPLLKDDPDVAELIPFRRHGWSSPAFWRDLLAQVRHLRAEAYDWVIDLQSLARSALVAWLARGQLTIGLDDPREGAPAFYDVRVPRPSPQTHAVDWYLAVLSRMRVPVHRSFPWFPERTALAQSIRQQWPLTEGPCLLLQPGARWENKRWPADHFAALVRQLHQAYPWLHFAVLGGSDEAPLAARILPSAPGRCVDLTGRLRLPELVEWIRAGAMLVTNDTGPMHVAAALGTPVVALFGPTDARRTGPYGQPDAVLRVPLPCAPCLRSHCTYHPPLACLTQLTPERVLTRVRQTLLAIPTRSTRLKS